MAKKSGMGKFLLGALGGIGIGALLSPKSGKENRDDLVKRLDVLKKRVKDIDVNGTEVLKNVLKDIKVVTIFLKVPKDELRRRLESRVDKPSKEEIDLRLSRFDYEESKIGSYDYVIKNDNLEKCVSIIQSIIENEIKAE